MVKSENTHDPNTFGFMLLRSKEKVFILNMSWSEFIFTSGTSTTTYFGLPKCTMFHWPAEH